MQFWMFLVYWKVNQKSIKFCYFSMHHVNVTANEVDDKESFSDSRLQIDSDSEDDEFWLWLQSDLKSDDKFGLNDGIIFY